MTVITTRIRVAADGAVSLADPLPEGEHVATVTVTEPMPAQSGKPFTMDDFPIHDRPLRQLASEPFDANSLPVRDLGLWPEGMSLRREDLYGDDGR